MFVAAGLMLATPSCKKGENDPFMSLSSRKARIAGDWEITGLTSSFRWDNSSDADWQTITQELTSGVILTTDQEFDSGNDTTITTTTNTTLNEATYTFGKDGTFSSVWNTTAVTITSFDFFGVTVTTTSTEVNTSSSSGDWSFIGKVKDEFKLTPRVMPFDDNGDKVIIGKAY